MANKQLEINEPKEMEFFSIEPDGKGGKQIHVFGYCYASDNDDFKEGCFWRNIEYTFFVEPLEKFIEHTKEDEDYANNAAVNIEQYVSDLYDMEIVELINHYFNGHAADALMCYSEITLETPCGNYMFEF